MPPGRIDLAPNDCFSRLLLQLLGLISRLRQTLPEYFFIKVTKCCYTAAGIANVVLMTVLVSPFSPHTKSISFICNVAHSGTQVSNEIEQPSSVTRATIVQTGRVCTIVTNFNVRSH